MTSSKLNVLVFHVKAVRVCRCGLLTPISQRTQLQSVSEEAIGGVEVLTPSR